MNCSLTCYKRPLLFLPSNVMIRLTIYDKSCVRWKRIVFGDIVGHFSFHSRRPSQARIPIFLCLMLMSRDVDGPYEWKYPCGVCSKPVSSRQRGFQFDVCCYWLHTKCIGLSNEDYSVLQQSDESWSSKKCQREAMPSTFQAPIPYSTPWSKSLY